jgi:hypothetical protein
MVFRDEAAPMSRCEFMKWYLDQTEWKEDHGYDDPANTSPELRNWFMEMIQTFPAMNGPFTSEDIDNDYVSDYSIGRDIIYIAFAWSVAEQANKRMKELAEKHSVGFFDPTTDMEEILLPVNGKLKSIDDCSSKSQPSSIKVEKKRWWKFWQR